MVKGSKGESSNDPKASTDSSTTIEDDEPKGKFILFIKYPFIAINYVAGKSTTILSLNILFGYNERNY